MPTGFSVAKITVSFNQIEIKNALQHTISLSIMKIHTGASEKC